MFPRHRLRTIFLALGLAVLGGAGGLILMDQIIMPLVVGKHRGHAIVPNLIHLSPPEAKMALEREGFGIEKEGEAFCDSVAAHKICFQRPQAGKEVKKGRTIYYKVSMGSELSTVPVLLGKTLRQAQLNLGSIGLKTGHIRYVFDDTAATDHVIGTTPAAGSSVSRGMEVDLLVSQGVEPTEAMVPNLVGLSYDESERLIKKVGLKVGSVSYQPRRELMSETVISQSLAPGSKVEREREIDLVVSSR